MKKLGVLTVVLVLVLAVVGYTLAQSPSPQGGMMGQGMGTMDPSKMGGQGGAMPCGTTGAAAGQPLPQEQLEQFAKQHGITVDQAKDMAKQCQQMMKTTPSKTQ
jgi:outer membrane lipoprotein SlyB